MTKEQLYKNLQNVNHSKDTRLFYANLMLDNPQLISPLLDILFTVDDKNSCRAAWVFEFMCSKKVEAIIPHLDIFTDNMLKVYLDSAVRPIAKISELLASTYYGKEDNVLKTSLTKSHREKIIEACFDWMISEQKVAPKAYGMNALYLMGTEFDWVHPELQIILERDFSHQSAAFKARARHILKRLNKKK